MPVVELNGKKVEVERDTIIIDLLKKHGIWIPTLCYHPALPPYGACRICLVEIVKKGWSQLVTSCSYPLRDDITILTHSERATKARNGIMQLLLARSPGNPLLVEMAGKMGIEPVSPYPKVTESQRDCILCGLCVHVCEKVIGASAISFADRGVNRTVAAPFRAASEDCIGCGACAMVCPMGTIKLRISENSIEISPFKNKVVLRRCRECGRELTGEIAATLVDRKLDIEEFLQTTATCDACKRKLVVKKLAAIPALKVPVGAGH